MFHGNYCAWSQWPVASCCHGWQSQLMAFLAGPVICSWDCIPGSSTWYIEAKNKILSMPVVLAHQHIGYILFHVSLTIKDWVSYFTCYFICLLADQVTYLKCLTCYSCITLSAKPVNLLAWNCLPLMVLPGDKTGGQLVPRTGLHEIFRGVEKEVGFWFCDISNA